jgi:hypothetical protein
MTLLLALLAARRYLGSRLGQTRRWMFVVPAVLAAFESARSIGSIYLSHVVASAIIACIALTFAIDFPGLTHGWASARRVRWFCIAAFLSVLLAHAALKPHPSDVPYTSIEAIRLMSIGLNPYKVDLDTFDYTSGNTKEERFRGYKYSPLLPIFYFPGVRSFGNVGILLSNTLVLVLTALTISALCRRILSGSGMWAAVLLLASPLVGWYALVSQANDLVAVLPVCVGFLVRDTRPGLAGLLLGVSTSIKIMPAPIAMALLLPSGLSTARRFVAGVAVGVMPIIVFAALDPSAFFNNVLLFQIVRPSSPASLVLNMPFIIFWLLRMGLVATFLATAAAALIRDWSIDRRMMAYIVFTMLLLLISQNNSNNYWLWWIPIFIPLLCAGWVVPPTAFETLGGKRASLFAR